MKKSNIFWAFFWLLLVFTFFYLLFISKFVINEPGGHAPIGIVSQIFIFVALGFIPSALFCHYSTECYDETLSFRILKITRPGKLKIETVYYIDSYIKRKKYFLFWKNTKWFWEYENAISSKKTKEKMFSYNRYNQGQSKIGAMREIIEQINRIDRENKIEQLEKEN